MKRILLFIVKFLGTTIVIITIFFLALLYRYIPMLKPKAPVLFETPKINSSLPNVDTKSNLSPDLKNLYTSVIGQTEQGFSYDTDKKNTNVNNSGNNPNSNNNNSNNVVITNNVKPKQIVANKPQQSKVVYYNVNNTQPKQVNINTNNNQVVTQIESVNQPNNTMVQTTYSSNTQPSSNTNSSQSNNGMITTVESSK